MNTLKNKLNKQTVKVNGQLQNTTTEELSSLSAATGRTSPPTSPLEAGVVGANPNQAKMAGVKDQRAAALRVAIRGDQNQQDAERTAQTRTEASTSEQEKQAQAQQLQQFSGLRGRVQAATNQILQQSAQQQITNNLRLNPEVLATLPPEQEPLIKAELAKLQANPNDNQAIVTLNNLLGKTNIQDMLTAEQLSDYFLSTSEQVGQQAAENVQDNLTVSQLNLQELGFNNPEELANLLGVDVSELPAMNVQELQSEIDAKIQDEFTQIEDLQRRATDPSLGAAERAEARKQLREMGAIGIRKLESDIDILADEIADSDTVEFNGEEIAVSDLLEDEYISGLAAKFLDPATDAGWIKKFKEKHPELASWFKEHSEALNEAVKGIDEGLKQFADIQEQNRDIAEPSTGQPPLPDDIMLQFFDDYGKLRADQYNIDQFPILKLIKSQDPIEAKNAYEAIKTVYQYHPGLLKQLKQLPEDKIRNLDILNNGMRWQKYTKYLQDYNRVKTMDATNPDSVYSALFGTTIDAKTAEAELKEVLLRQRSGLFGSTPIDQIARLISEGGRLLPPAEIARRLDAEMVGPGSAPRSLLDYSTGQRDVTTLADKTGKVQLFNRAPDESGIYNIVKFAFENDGEIDRAEVQQLPTEALETVYTSLKHKLNSKSQAAIENRFVEETAKDLQSDAMAERRIDIQKLHNLARDFDFRESNKDIREQFNAANNYLNEKIKSSESPLEKMALRKQLQDMQELKKHLGVSDIVRHYFNPKQPLSWLVGKGSIPLFTQVLEGRKTGHTSPEAEADARFLVDSFRRYGPTLFAHTGLSDTEISRIEEEMRKI